MEWIAFLKFMEMFGAVGVLACLTALGYLNLKSRHMELHERVEQMDEEGTVKLKVLESRLFTEISDIKSTQARIEKRVDKLLDMHIRDSNGN